MTTLQLLSEIKKRKILFILLPAIVFVVAFGIFYKMFQQFSATASFIVNESDESDVNVSGQFNTDYFNKKDVNVNRLYRFAFSSEMEDFLIKKFDLYTYYQINPKEQLAYSRVVDRLAHSIRIQKTDPNIIQLTITDRDRFLPAAMANDFMTELNKINERYIKSQLRKKLVLYQALYLDSKNEVEQHELKIAQLLDNFKSVINSLDKNNADVNALKYALLDLSDSFKTKRDEMTKMKQMYSVMSQTLEKESLETITIINLAVPDYHSKIFQITMICLFLALIADCILVLWLNFYLSNLEYFQFFFYNKTS